MSQVNAVTATISHQQDIAWFFAVKISFFARGPHTRAAVARLPLRQLGFLVHCYKLVCIAACVCGCGTAKLSTVDKTLPAPLHSAI